MAFYLLPQHYDYVPEPAAVEKMVGTLRTFLGEAKIDHWENLQAQVIGDLTTGSQEITCPICGAVETFKNPAGFGEMLLVQSAETIEFEMPCCGNTANLAQIDLTPNTKFSRFVFEVITDANLSSQQLKLLSQILGDRTLIVPFEICDE